MQISVVLGCERLFRELDGFVEEPDPVQRPGEVAVGVSVELPVFGLRRIIGRLTPFLLVLVRVLSGRLDPGINGRFIPGFMMALDRVRQNMGDPPAPLNGILDFLALQSAQEDLPGLDRLPMLTHPAEQRHSISMVDVVID